jgi:hypothetical protein
MAFGQELQTLVLVGQHLTNLKYKKTEDSK